MGADPFADVQVSREQMRLRIEQGLRNSELRLRRRYLSIFDDAPSVATDYPPPANPSPHRWRVNLPSLAGQLVKAGKDWRAYLQNFPESGTSLANWPGDNNTAKLYAVKHNPFAYFASIQSGEDRKLSLKQMVGFDQLWADLAAHTADWVEPITTIFLPSDETRAFQNTLNAFEIGTGWNVWSNLPAGDRRTSTGAFAPPSIPTTARPSAPTSSVRAPEDAP